MSENSVVEEQKMDTNSDPRLSDEQKEQRQAMRAFLQRTEVRLSTMHRIAGAFLNGAGLLLLFPVFFGQAIKDIILSYISYLTIYSSLSNFKEALFSNILSALSSILIVIPFFISLYIPLFALYNLLKDIIHFYFAGHSPGFSDRLVHPRFVLTGIAFSPDESLKIKHQVYNRQYFSDLANFIVPFDEDKCDYFDKVKRETEDLIIPQTREFDELVHNGVIGKITKDEKVKIERFNTALGLAGVIDRPLVEEVAKMETSLVRHALCLRRLVLRYAKALLAFILTTLISFFIIPLAQKLNPLVIFAISYSIWSYFTPKILSWPLKWIKEYSKQDGTSKAVAGDEQLVNFENAVTKICFKSFIISLISLLLVILSYLVPVIMPIFLSKP